MAWKNDGLSVETRTSIARSDGERRDDAVGDCHDRNAVGGGAVGNIDREPGVGIDADDERTSWAVARRMGSVPASGRGVQQHCLFTEEDRT